MRQEQMAKLDGTKAEDLKRISAHYHLKLKIEEGKP
jgi:hypothetical protein